MHQNRAGLEYEHVSPCLEISQGDMGMKSSLVNTSHRIGMLTHSVCRRKTKLHSEPRGVQDNEFCVAACALITKLTDFHAVRARGKTHKVRSQELEVGLTVLIMLLILPQPHHLSPRTDHLSDPEKGVGGWNLP